MDSRVTSQGLIELGERIRKRRQEIHLSQEAFAEKTGISVNTVGRVEGGQTAMSVEIFRRMVEILEADASELLGEHTFMAEEKSHLRNMVFRIHHLKERDQEIVLQTMDALIDGLNGRR